MKKGEEGIVVEVDGKTAKVRASGHGDCKNCGACPGDNAIVFMEPKFEIKGITA